MMTSTHAQVELTASGASLKSPVFISQDLQLRLRSNEEVALAFRRDGPVAAYYVLSSKLEEQSGDAISWALLGELALLADLPDKARESLERAVLIDPNLPGAWLDLSVALMYLGEMEQSQHYLEYVQREFAPQEKMQGVVAQFQERNRDLLREKYRWHYVVTSGIGYDSNANSGLSASVITLTSGADRIPLVLSDAYHARSDAYALVGLQAKQELALTGTGWRLQYGYGLRQRQFLKESSYSTTELGAQLQGILPLGDSSNMLLGGQFEFVRLGAQNVLAVTRISLARDKAWSYCRVMPGLEFENRQYLLEPQLSGQIVWLLGQSLCHTGLWRMGAQARLGLDHPMNQRAGGQTYRGESNFYLGRNVSERLHIKFSTTVSWAKDQQGYSPWLDNEARRHTARWQYRSEWTYYLSPNWETVWGLEKNQTNSNISIFNQSSWQSYLLLRVSY